MRRALQVLTPQRTPTFSSTVRYVLISRPGNSGEDFSNFCCYEFCVFYLTFEFFEHFFFSKKSPKLLQSTALLQIFLTKYLAPTGTPKDLPKAQSQWQYYSRTQALLLQLLLLFLLQLLHLRLHLLLLLKLLLRLPLLLPSGLISHDFVGGLVSNSASTSPIVLLNPVSPDLNQGLVLGHK